jgi:hypothetical protein
MTYEQFAAALHECGWRGPDVRSLYTLIDVYNRMRNEIGQIERVNCRRQVEAFAVAYVEKWERIQSRSKDTIKAQGWAILQSAVDLTAKPTGEP